MITTLQYLHQFLQFYTVVSRKKFFHVCHKCPLHLNTVLALPCENTTLHFILLENITCCIKHAVKNIKLIKYREDKLTVTKYVQNVCLSHELHKHAKADDDDDDDEIAYLPCAEKLYRELVLSTAPKHEITRQRQ